MFVALSVSQLSAVSGGDMSPAPPNAVNPMPGRCGPGASWTWMNRKDGSPIVTPQCLAHDNAVDGALMKGQSTVQANWNARGLFWPAAKSWASAWIKDRVGL